MLFVTLKTCFLILCAACLCFCDLDPYRVLNVPRNAKLSEIRRVYKELVRKWHPDKNRAPNAEERFIEIQQAYEILSDSEKRQQYDSYGYTGQQHQQGNAQNYRYSDFEFYSEQDPRVISYTQFTKKVLPNSFHTPQILFFYQSFSARSVYILKTSWDRTAKDLEKIGIGVGTVDTRFSSRISSYLGVRSTPKVVLIYEDEYYHYSGMILYANLKEYISAQLPKHLVQTIGPSNIDSFLSGILHDDKPRAVLFSKQTQPTLLYFLMAIKHKKYYRFGFASLSDVETKSLAKTYGVRGFGPTLLIFKENTNIPTVALQSSDMPRGAVNEILTLHRFMIVPRLTSQDVFDEVCSTGQSYHVSLCAIFVTNDQWEGHKRSLDNLREVVSAAQEDDEQLSDWLKFVFVISSKQKPFVTSLSGKDQLPDKPVIYLLWRRGSQRGLVSRFSTDFLESDVSLDYGFQKFLAACLQSSNQRQFEREIRLSPLSDELAPFFIFRLASQAWKTTTAWIGYLISNSEQETMFFLITVVVIIISLISKAIEKLDGFFRSGKSNRRTQSQRSSSVYENRRYSEEDDEVEVVSSDEEDLITEKSHDNILQELRPATYRELVLKQRSGRFTIVFLLDQHDHMINDFIELMKKCKGDKQLSFSFLKVSLYLTWFKELRNTSSPEPPKSRDQSQEDLSESSLHSGASPFNASSNDITCASAHGTVLALNGSKHWYCLFVPRSRRQQASRSPSHASDSPPEDLFSSGDHNSEGDWCKDEPSSSNGYSGTSNRYSSSLSLWFDRVRDGQYPRLYVRQWPCLYEQTPDSSGSDDDF